MIITGTRVRGGKYYGGTASAAVTDSYFNLVALLLPGNGTNGAQNNTFLDSSTNNFSITRNGNTTGVKAIYSTSVASTANYGYFTFYVNGSSLAFYNRAATGGAETGIVAGTLSANTWTHVAISVNSNSGRLYVDGTQVGSTTTINTTTFTPVYNTIGADILQGYGFNGYINDLRITRGLARYTANFTPPATAFPTQ